MHDRPDPSELALAVLDFLREELLPVLDDPRLTFRARVASNGLAILARQMEHETPALKAEAQRLAALLQRQEPDCDDPEALRAAVTDLNRELCRRIRRDKAPTGTLEAIRAGIDDKLRVAAPRTLERYARPSGGDRE